MRMNYLTNKKVIFNGDTGIISRIFQERTGCRRMCGMLKSMQVRGADDA